MQTIRINEEKFNFNKFLNFIEIEYNIELGKRVKMCTILSLVDLTSDRFVNDNDLDIKREDLFSVFLGGKYGIFIPLTGLITNMDEAYGEDLNSLDNIGILMYYKSVCFNIELVKVDNDTITRLHDNYILDGQVQDLLEFFTYKDSDITLLDVKRDDFKLINFINCILDITNQEDLILVDDNNLCEKLSVEKFDFSNIPSGTKLYFEFAWRDEDYLICADGNSFFVNPYTLNEYCDLEEAYFEFYENISLGYLLTFKEDRIIIKVAKEGEITLPIYSECREISNCGELKEVMKEYIENFIN